MELNFTQGSITSKLLKFTIPILIALILQQLYGAVDLLIVGNFASSSDVSAVSSGSQLIASFIYLVAGLSMGTTILLGKKIGAKEYNDAGKVIGGGIYIFIIIAIFITILIGFFPEFSSNLMNAPEAAFDQTVSYIKIMGFGSVFLVAFNILGSIFRGLGDSKTPLIAVSIATVANIVLDYIFIKEFKLGASGAAIATVIAQAISVIFSLVIIFKKKLNFNFDLKMIKYQKEYTKKTISLGIPVALNSFLVSLSFLFIMAIANQFGVTISAGIGITERLIGFLMIIPMSFGQSLASFTAQNVGAKLEKRAERGLYVAVTISIMVAIITIIVTLLFGEKMLGIFSNDKDVIAIAFDYLKAYCFDIFLTATLFCFIGFFNGHGKTSFTMYQGLIGSLIFRIPFSYLFSLYQPTSVFLIGLATPIGTFFQNAFCFYYFYHIRKKY